MLTFFTTAKPFRGQIGTIQRNALRSWTLLHPDVEVILFGDDEGATEAAQELGIKHEPWVERNEFGLKRIDYYFDRAQVVARHDILCYVNCDIIFMPDFCRALERVRGAHSQFLMVGRRWDADFEEAIDFSNSSWVEQARRHAITSNCRKDWWWIDYFVFSRGLYYKKIPAFVIGRVVWDNWLIWRAIDLGIPVVDASGVVCAVHQNHDYAYHPLGRQGVWNDEQARRNFRYAGGWNHIRTIADANEILGPKELSRNWKRYWMALKRTAAAAQRFLVYEAWLPTWHFFLDATRPMRSVLGFRSRATRSHEKA